MNNNIQRAVLFLSLTGLSIAMFDPFCENNEHFEQLEPRMPYHFVISESVITASGSTADTITNYYGGFNNYNNRLYITEI